MDLHGVGALRAAAERVDGGDREGVDARLARRAVDLRRARAVTPEREPRRQRAGDEPEARRPVAVGADEVRPARRDAQERADVAVEAAGRSTQVGPPAGAAACVAPDRERDRRGERAGADRFSRGQVYQRRRVVSSSVPPTPSGDSTTVSAVKLLLLLLVALLAAAPAGAGTHAAGVTNAQLAVMPLPKSQLGSLATASSSASALGRPRQRGRAENTLDPKDTAAQLGRGAAGSPAPATPWSTTTSGSTP